MRHKKETLEHIVGLMDIENLSLQDIEMFKRTYYSKTARSWLHGKHQPGWFINEEGCSAETLEELDILDPEFEPFGIWLTDHIIVSSRIMQKESSYREAEKFIMGTSLGPFYFRLPSGYEQISLSGNLQIISDALIRSGLPKIPQGYFWTAAKIRLNKKELVAVSGIDRAEFAYSEPDENHLGVFIINVG